MNCPDCDKKMKPCNDSIHGNPLFLCLDCKEFAYDW
jgi:hypothetical protein